MFRTFQKIDVKRDAIKFTNTLNKTNLVADFMALFLIFLQVNKNKKNKKKFCSKY